MSFKYKDQTFMTEDDLKVNILGSYPTEDIKNSELKENL